MKTNECFVLRKIDSVYFLIEIRRNSTGIKLFYLNNIGAFIWESISNCDLDSNALLKRILDNFKCDETVVKNDLEKFIEILNNNGLLIS